MLTGCTATGTAQAPAQRAPSPTRRAVGAAGDGYSLRRHCFCTNRGLTYRVTVRDGAVVRVEYAETVRDHAAGEQALDAWPGLTIDDVIVIAKSDDSESDRPESQAYPNDFRS